MRPAAAAWLALSGMASLASLLLLLPLAGGQQFTVLPDLPDNVPQPAFDTGFPLNIPDGLPTQLPSPTAADVLNVSAAPAAACATSVTSVLAANGRTALLQLLQGDPVGQQVLDGRAYATILAPSNQGLARLPATAQDPAAAATPARYHIVRAVQQLTPGDVDAAPVWTTALDRADCRTAFTTVTVLRDPAAPPDRPAFLVRSAASTARVTAANIPACNSVVHLLDGALQPCCSSLWELLPTFSMVKIQPSYFDGFTPVDKAPNTDASNRQIFEEQMVDLLLHMTPNNITSTVLWPMPQAWDNVQLARLLPDTDLTDPANRKAALRALALYLQSYQDVVLPQDIPQPDGSSPALTLTWQSSLRNATNASTWDCPDALTVAAPRWSPPAVVVPPAVPETTADPSRGAPTTPATTNGQGAPTAAAAAAAAAGGGGQQQPGGAAAAAARNNPNGANPDGSQQPASAQAAPGGANLPGANPAAGAANLPGPQPADQQQQQLQQQQQQQGPGGAVPNGANQPSGAAGAQAGQAGAQGPNAAGAQGPSTAAAQGPNAAVAGGANPGAPDAAGAASTPGNNPNQQPAVNPGPAANAGQQPTTGAAGDPAAAGAPGAANGGGAAIVNGALFAGRRLAADQQQQQQQQRQASSGALLGADGALDGSQCSTAAAARALKAAATGGGGGGKRVTATGVLDTCESIRVVMVDAVPIPCDFDKVTAQMAEIEARMAQKRPGQQGPTTLGGAMVDWLIQAGIIKVGETGANGYPGLMVPGAVVGRNAAGMAGGAGWRALAAGVAAAAAAFAWL